MKRIIPLLCVIAWVSVSCNKEGIGGKAVISGAVLHHETAIPNAVVYIKYGATSWPGFDPDLYDNHVTASSSDASYSFTNLYKGNYYIWASGEDATIMETVSGGIGVKLISKKETLVIDVPVTE